MIGNMEILKRNKARTYLIGFVGYCYRVEMWDDSENRNLSCLCLKGIAPSPPKITDTQRGVRYFYRNVEFELAQSALRFEKALLRGLLIGVNKRQRLSSNFLLRQNP